MHDYNDKWMRVNSDDPDSQVCSGRLTTALQRPGPALQYLKKRYTPRKKEISYHEEECISEGFYLKGKTLKAETLKTNFTGEVGQ